MGFCPCEPSGTSAGLCVDEKGRGLEGEASPLQLGPKAGRFPPPPRSPQYGHCPAVNNVATPAMWAASRALTMNQISFFSVKEV